MASSLNIGIVQLVQVSPVDLQSFGLNPPEVLQALCLDQDFEDSSPLEFEGGDRVRM
jgi:hypothetical protein